MRLLGLLLTAFLVAATAVAQEGQPPPKTSSADDGRAANLPVSLDKIKQGLEQAPAEPLRGLDERPHFRVEIRERQKIEELLSTLRFDSGPAVPGGIYGYEQQQRAFPKTDNPLAQPYAAFNQGQLATILFEEFLEKYLGGRMVQGITDASRAHAEEAARQEVQRALAEFCAVHSCSQP